MIITKRLSRGYALILVLVSGGLVAGCGGASDPGSGSVASAGAGAATSTTVAVGPRSFGYVNNGLEATMRLDGAAGTVVFTNGRTTPVLTPVIYLLDPLGVRVDAVLPGARSIPPGRSATLAVRFPSDTNTATAGFFGLELGGTDAGGFVDR